MAKPKRAASEQQPVSDQQAVPKRQLTLFDSTCIIVGIIIGAGIYESTPSIAANVPSFGWLVVVWLLGGLCSLIGALCYAELATAWPEEGGDYVYLTRAFGRSVGFLFAWAQLWIVRPGSIGAMAYVFARYADRLVPVSQFLAALYRSFAPSGLSAEQLAGASRHFGESVSLLIYAAGSVVFFSLINIAGVREGKWTQNLLTMAKVLGLGGIFAAGMFFGGRQPQEQPTAARSVARTTSLGQSGSSDTAQPSEPGETRVAPQVGNAQAAGEVIQIPAEALEGDAGAAAGRRDPNSAEPALSAADTSPAQAQAGPDESEDFTLAMFGLAMIFVLYTYGGWNEMAYVSAEVRNPRKNILRAMVLGTLAVTLIYVLVTWAFVRSLGLEGTENPKTTVAEDVLRPVADWMFDLPERRSKLQSELEAMEAAGSATDTAVPAGELSQRKAAIEQQLKWLERLGRLPGVALCVLICISALGAVNGMIFTGARIYYAMGRDHRLYAWLGRWSARRGTPVISLVIQGAITLAVVVGFGLLELKGLSEGGFDSMVIFTAPAFWFFLVLVGLAVGELRWREPDRERPFRVPLYPIVPVLFCLSSLFMLYSSIDYAFQNRSAEVLWCVIALVAGLVACFWDVKEGHCGTADRAG